MTTIKKIKIAQYLCLIPGVFLIISGLLVLFASNGAAALFDMNDIETFKTPFAFAMGIRQIAIGLIITVLAYSEQIKALGIVMLIGSIVPISDFIIFGNAIGWVSSLRHAASVPMILSLGFYILNQLKKSELK